ncbi:hemerythrin domain-containing protein [Lacibacterium aquatile]|uniref:Hemerythrin domain-containing protein n=1 Tax=Lacibacterium aquatile TaxID=1168082 RepID=A0ABW5E181_9PROT
MATIVSRLKHDHGALRDVLEKVRLEGIGTEAGRKTLLTARALFVEHIQREDRDFYPDFKRLAHERGGQAATADQFADEMGDLGAQVLGFFDKYKDGGSGMEFARDFGRMHAMLNARLRKEEGILYAKFEEMAG